MNVSSLAPDPSLFVIKRLKIIGPTCSTAFDKIKGQTTRKDICGVAFGKQISSSGLMFRLFSASSHISFDNPSERYVLRRRQAEVSLQRGSTNAKTSSNIKLSLVRISADPVFT